MYLKTKPPDAFKRDFRTVEGSGMGRDKKEEAIYQNLFDATKREIALVYLPGTMAHIKEHYKEDIDSSKAFLTLIQR